MGCTAFGGLMPVVAMMQNIMVERHKLLTNEDILDGISLSTLLPGPNLVMVVAYVGHHLRGGIGAFVSVLGFMLPAFLLVVSLTIAYLKWGQLAMINKLFLGFVPAISAIIIYSAWNFAHKTITNKIEIFLGVTAACLLLVIGGFYITLFIIFSSAIFGSFIFHNSQVEKADTNSELQQFILNKIFSIKFLLTVIFFVSLLTAFLIPLPIIEQNSLANIAITFSGISLFLFGGGLVSISLIQEIVVDTLAWVTQTEFITAIAMGQMTPGPIMINVAFIGYKIQGLLGALIATMAIFFPPTLLMIIASKLHKLLKKSARIQAALKGIHAVVVGIIFSTAIIVGQNVAIHWASLVIFIIALIVMFRWHINVMWIIPISGIFGLLFY
jgi:chromate transporter